MNPKDRDPHDEGLILVALVAAVVVACLLLRCAWRHPVTAAWAAVSALAYLALGPWSLAGLWAYGLGLLATWRWLRPRAGAEVIDLARVS